MSEFNSLYGKDNVSEVIVGRRRVSIDDSTKTRIVRERKDFLQNKYVS